MSKKRKKTSAKGGTNNAKNTAKSASKKDVQKKLQHTQRCNPQNALPFETKDSQSCGQQKSQQEAENGNNDGSFKGRAVTYMIIWIVYTLGTAFLPIGLTLLFDLIIGYPPSFNEFAPDYLLMVVSILFGSAWNTWRNKAFAHKELRQLVMILQIAVAFICFFAYFIMYGELSVYIVAKIGRVIPIIIVFFFLGILLADIVWDAKLHRNEYFDELSSEK